MPNPIDMENASVARATVGDEMDSDQSLSSSVKDAGVNMGKKAAKKKLSERGKAKKGGGGDSSSEQSSPKGPRVDEDGNGASDDLLGNKDAKKGEEGNELADAKKAAKNVKRGAKVAGTAVKTGMLAKMMGFFQMAMGMMGNAAAAVLGGPAAFLQFLGNVASAVAGFFSSVGTAVAGFFTSIGTSIAGFLGIGTAVGTATAVAGFATAGISAALIISSVVVGMTNTAQRDGVLPDCTVAVEAAMEGAEVDADAQLLANAQSIYSILHVYGMSDEQVAGVLGNFSTESGIDPTTIEGIYDENYTVTAPKHKDAMADLDAYVRGPLSDKYAGFSGSGGPVKNPGGYTADDGKMYPGLGMGQYTGGGAKTFLDFADSVSQKWYTIEFQMAYTLAKGAPASGAGFWERYKSQTGDAAAMARYFSQYWEGNTSNGWQERQDSAASWYSQLQDWSANDSYANGVIALAEQLGATATDGNVASKKSTCVKTLNADNSSIASAAVSYAYETQDEGRGNDGTELYRRVHDAIWGAGDIYQSCDRGVATAIQWSGADIEYPAGDTGAQLAYLMSSPKWEEVGTSGSVTMDELLPGDVFCLDGHTFLYTGNEIVRQKYPESNGDSVSASYCERSPGVGRDSSNIVVDRNGQDGIGRGEYHIFRLVFPDNSTKWESAGSAS